LISPQVVAWIIFGVLILVMMALDLGIFHRRSHEVRFKEAVIWTGVWISLALLFALGIRLWEGPEKALEFLTAYLVEESLSMDNIFVFLLIFTYFKVPNQYQHRVLFWGIIGALIMRGIFIATGVALIQTFHWIIYIFGAFLIVTGLRMAFEHGREIHPEKNPVLGIVRRVVPLVRHFHGAHFFIHRNGKILATPLLVVLVMVETSDIIFALDSIPAVLAISQDPFIVYTSNIFAILGLRSLYFALAGFMERFRYLHYGLSAILVFIGLKMLVADIWHIRVGWALGIIGFILALSVAASLLLPSRAKTEEPLVSLGEEN